MKVTLRRAQDIPRALSQNAALLSLLKGERTLFFQQGKRVVLQLGVGARKLSLRQCRLIIRRAIAETKRHGISRLVVPLSECQRWCAFSASLPRLAELWALEGALADFSFLYRKPRFGEKGLTELILLAAQSDLVRLRQSARRGMVIAEEVNRCRALANTPGGEMTPRLLARAARDAARRTAVTVKVLRESSLRRLKMGGVLGVSRGSAEPPRFIVMEYWGGTRKQPPVVLVGKGVTFDTGGLNLKPTDHILDMHMDMSGGAAVIHALVLAARLRIRRNVVGLIPAVENMPSGESLRPGDILTMMSGVTVEVLNTDAEGRIILADALTYAARYHPSLVVDIATLTGASMVALGQRAAAIFTRDDALADLCGRLGEETGDYVWRLPLWDEYAEEIRGTFADFANVQKSKYGGAIIGAVFLEQFAKQFPKWLHIDIAPRMTSIEGEYLAKGATGAGVQLLLRLLEEV
ncbi:leucyl aminopeptidase [Candidatus Parcubacteria bacterium]|nr:MAG: leucyl aminopeptidase [Candidatus Parcubacteria bacterium]